MSAKHTPTPWFVKGDQVIGNGDVVADCFQLPQDNAEFIVSAVNSHEALLEAAKAYKEKYFDRAENQDELTDEAKAIIKAIAQAEVKS